ncbi:hypothetical protein [Thermosulfidibacter takaii]|uniref:hypothetical protein n=1 Tax=Thermosulfidibacter takaii TaxID=412593 RepID=UPI000838BAE7|nr:hypothetical protein [Thermosulfidibacter takaii]
MQGVISTVKFEFVVMFIRQVGGNVEEIWTGTFSSSKDIPKLPGVKTIVIGCRRIFPDGSVELIMPPEVITL